MSQNYNKYLYSTSLFFYYYLKVIIIWGIRMGEFKGKLRKVLEESLANRGYEIVRSLSERRENSNSNSNVYLTNYKAKQEQQQEQQESELQQRALKVYSALMVDDVGGVRFDRLDERTQREVGILKKIKHPNIPEFRDAFRVPFGEFGYIDALAMQYIDAENLLKIIERGERINEDEARKILTQILSALKHVHTEIGEQVVHRDIKPSNILFDGNEAYLFDFNFSKVGEGTSNTTMIDNFGYYPLDVYSGKQTPSQDLVALGNVIIALGYGEEIMGVRARQGKERLNAVDVDNIPFTQKLKRFLRKLTAENPAFRYQTAEKAGEDLKNLDKTTELELEERATTITRNKGLVKLLEKLGKEDRLFNYNVPNKIRETYDDDTLMDHLEKTYRKPGFRITNPEDIKKYARCGSRVVSKRTSVGYGLNHKSKVDFKAVKGDKVEISYAGSDFEVDPVDLFIEEEDKSKQISVLKYTKTKTSFWSKKELKLNGFEALERGQRLIYNGEDAVEIERIPEGSEGLVVGISQGSNKDLYFNIIFEENPGLKQWLLRGDLYYRGECPGNGFKTRSYINNFVDLIVRNYIDFEKLKRESFAET